MLLFIPIFNRLPQLAVSVQPHHIIAMTVEILCYQIALCKQATYNICRRLCVPDVILKCAFEAKHSPALPPASLHRQKQTLYASFPCKARCEYCIGRAMC